jgi:hypothetical protein
VVQLVIAVGWSSILVVQSVIAVGWSSILVVQLVIAVGWSAVVRFHGRVKFASDKNQLQDKERISHRW